MNEVVLRQECTFDWQLIAGGAVFSVTSSHRFDIRGKVVSFLAVGTRDRDRAGSPIAFVSIVAGRPVEGSAQTSIGNTAGTAPT